MTAFTFCGKDGKPKDHIPGFYPATCSKAEEATSKNGNDMFVVTIDIDDGGNKTRAVKDYFVAIDSFKAKFKEFWEASNGKRLLDDMDVSPDVDMFEDSAFFVMTCLECRDGKTYCRIIDYIPRFAAPYTGPYQGADIGKYVDSAGALKVSAPRLKIDWSAAPLDSYQEDDIPF